MKRLRKAVRLKVSSEVPRKALAANMITLRALVCDRFAALAYNNAFRNKSDRYLRHKRPIYFGFSIL